MKPNELAAAVERLRLAETDFAAAYAEFAECSGQRLLDYVTVADAYLARESDDAKPVDRDWLDDSVGGRIENTYLHPHADGQGRCDAIEEIGGEWWAYLACMESAGSAAARRLDTRGDVRAFLRLARWPANETTPGGGAAA